jgi:small ligand-binding sensory domain FIST
MDSAGNAFASAISTRNDLREALAEVVDSALTQLNATPHLAMLFISPHHLPQSEQLIAELKRALPEETKLLGCGGETIAGVGQEIEDQPAISLWLAALPHTQITTMHLEFQRTTEGMAISGWPDELAGTWQPDSFLIALGEPFSFPADVMLDQLNQDRPGIPVVGGMASAAASPGKNRLFLNRGLHSEGAVVAHLSGGVKLRTVVSQGCRPVGKPFVITKAERNIVYQLGGKPALGQLQEMFAALPTREQVAARQGLHLGRVVNEYLATFSQGDFLIRNVTGIDQASGALSLGDYFRVGQTVQFHIRDHESADAELHQLLAAVRDLPAPATRGALLFSCNGRGTRLFPTPHHDAQVIQQQLGTVPLAGFFAQGEMGPIGGRNFLHGFTASIAILEGE